MGCIYVSHTPYCNVLTLIIIGRHDANGHSDMADTILKKAQALEEERRQNRGNHKENPRAHAALGDIIMHRAQFMTRRKLYNECDEVINSWAPCDVDAPTDIETKTYSDLKTANARNLLAQGEESKAKEILLDITHPVQERTATGEIRNIMHLNAHSFHWATVTLSEIFCKEGKFEEALKLVNPRIDEFEKSDIGHEFLFVDYLRLRCEAALRLKDFTAVEGFMNDLIKELDDSLRQAGNLRQFEQMATAKSLWARFHHMQQSWEAAIDFWKAVLSWYGIEVPQNANLSDGKHKYDIAVSILSLAICFAEAHQKESHELFDRLDSHPESLVHPAHNPDYTQWLAYLCKSRKIPEKLREKLNQNKERRSRRTKMLKF